MVILGCIELPTVVLKVKVPERCLNSMFSVQLMYGAYFFSLSLRAHSLAQASLKCVILPAVIDIRTVLCFS